MSLRTIPCIVSDEYVKGAGVPVGAAGSHNDVLLELTFSPLWEGLAKKITWYDALKQTSTFTILTTNLLKEGETDVYLVPIPPEPKAVAGDMTMTIKGVTVENGVETRATLSASCQFRVLSAEWDDDADETQDVNPTQAEQLQAEIEKVKEDIVDARAAATESAASAGAAAVSAQGASESQRAAAASQIAAAESEANALASKNAAVNAAGSAAGSAAAAKTSKEAAEDAETNAEASAQVAFESAGIATASAGEAAASAAEAKASADAAEGFKSNAASNATAAAGSAAEAKDSKAAAEKARDEAQESAGNAEYWADVAQGAAAGGVSTFNGRFGAVAPQKGDYTAEMVGADPAGSAANEAAAHNRATDAHSDLFAAKADLKDGKVPASQLPAMDYDPAGSAAAVQGNLNTHDGNTTKHVTAEERTAWNSKAAGTHTHTKSQITDFPSSLPASDVYSWAKEASKPSYGIGEISGIADYVVASGVSGVWSYWKFNSGLCIAMGTPTVTWGTAASLTTGQYRSVATLDLTGIFTAVMGGSCSNVHRFVNCFVIPSGGTSAELWATSAASASTGHVENFDTTPHVVLFGKWK